jgi:hypothetical protein
VVIIPAGVPRKPGMTRDDLFKVRAAALPARGQPSGGTCAASQAARRRRGAAGAPASAPGVAAAGPARRLALGARYSPWH